MIIPININEKGEIVNNKAQLRTVVHNCGQRPGVYLVRFTYAGQPKNITEARRYYFAICDMVSDEGNTGYTGKEIHEVLKYSVLPIIDETFTSTKNLKTIENWIHFIDEVKKFIKENFEFYI